MFAWTPWSLARRTAAGRRAAVLLVLAALLYGFGMHAARACADGLVAVAQAGDPVGDPPCHHGDIDVAQAACEAHCRTDTQSGRLSLGFDLPPAAPVDLVATLAPPIPTGPPLPEVAPPRRDSGPPLHILLHRLLR
jgi:hypothetical protein